MLGVLVHVPAAKPLPYAEKALLVGQGNRSGRQTFPYPSSSDLHNPPRRAVVTRFAAHAIASRLFLVNNSTPPSTTRIRPSLNAIKGRCLR
jgi:hypothetical protein